VCYFQENIIIKYYEKRRTLEKIVRATEAVRKFSDILKGFPACESKKLLARN